MTMKNKSSEAVMCDCHFPEAVFEEVVKEGSTGLLPEPVRLQGAVRLRLAQRSRIRPAVEL